MSDVVPSKSVCCYAQAWNLIGSGECEHRRFDELFHLAPNIANLTQWHAHVTDTTQVTHDHDQCTGEFNVNYLLTNGSQKVWEHKMCAQSVCAHCAQAGHASRFIGRNLRWSVSANQF